MKFFSDKYPVWFCDIWGVVHDGHKIFASNTKALSEHRNAGGTVVLVTNSPRSNLGVVKQLDEIGVSRDCYDAVVSSGDVTRSLMVEKGGRDIFRLGPDRDLSVFDGLDVQFVDVVHAKAVVCTGLVNDHYETPADYVDVLADFKNRGLPMICANPDKIVRKGNKLQYCAGSLAEAYQKIGGTVYMAGKPFAPIYDLAIATASKISGRAVSNSDVLAIGDGPETDVKGAADYGLATVLILGGVMEGRTVAEGLAATMQALPHAKIVLATEAMQWS